MRQPSGECKFPSNAMRPRHQLIDDLCIQGLHAGHLATSGITLYLSPSAMPVARPTSTTALVLSKPSA
jgi:hypothetical protein